MHQDLRIIMFTASVRAIAVSGLSILFGLHLAQLGLDEVRIGLLIGTGLLGMAAGTLVAARFADRWGRRRSLVVLSLMMSAGGVCLAFADDVPLLMLASFVGMVNGMGRDRGALQAIDQAVIAQASRSGDRTTTFARYTIWTDVASAAGALLAAVPRSPESLRDAVFVYAALAAIPVLAYRAISPAAETVTPAGSRTTFSPASKRRVVVFASLSTLDSVGGGFITRSLLTYWFVTRFGVDQSVLGPMFAVTLVVNALAYPVAARLARRFGLVNTMVFTHIPSSILLMLVPFAPSFLVAAPLYIVREFFAPMDVPTRQSYLSAIVADHERSAAAGTVNTVRNASWVVGPVLGGWAMTLSLSAPLYIAGVLKIAYDLALWRAFRTVRPPEELSASSD